MSPASRGSEPAGRLSGTTPHTETPYTETPYTEIPYTDTHPGTIRTFRLGPLQLTTVEGGPVRMVRPTWLITSGPGELGEPLVVMAPAEGVIAVEQDGRAAQVHLGDIVFCDLARPVRIGFPSPFRTNCLVLPRRLLGLTESGLRRLTAVPVRPDSTPGALLSLLPAKLVDTASTLPPATGETLARHVVDLMSVLAEEWLHQEAQGVQGVQGVQRAQGVREAMAVPGAGRELLPRVKQFIDQHLGDPRLTPEVVARAHRISVRYLHKLFEHEDTTVGRWIQRRRLQECRRELARHRTAGRTIAAVARQWGFTSAAHFSRAFRTMYGMSPAEWRNFTLRASCTPDSGGVNEQYGEMAA